MRAARRGKRWTQQHAAARLGLSQPYLSMLENGERKLTRRLARRFRSVFDLPPTFVPPSDSSDTRPVSQVAQTLAEQLAALGYPGFAYLAARRRAKNPAEVLLRALAQDELEARVMEALPWVLVTYWDMDTQWVIQRAKLRDLQNRLGFVVSLARELAERREPRNDSQVHALTKLEATLEQSRLAREEPLGKRNLTAREREWLAKNRPETARRWNLLTDWRVECLPYAA